MSDVDGNEQDLLVKHVIRQFMKNQLNELKEEKQEGNNSFVFLENSTLNMLIIHLLMNGGRQTSREMNDDFLGELEQVIVETKKEFEEVIMLLKEKL
ncbi:hypothetical protein [Sporosarcina limicola]|uniref:Uncharacterized protein YceH (UPF0502 family) n=1 Tax=Sporosarcina limicola TaxID=34101 RepID=A0A927REZ3_9BACL|nr:hypothetical protein [Sporosarcina limicola]MBE1556785.1 uncharacterized protein YceH (UPF0502 family) [Sporosarcina limicola]